MRPLRYEVTAWFLFILVIGFIIFVAFFIDDYSTYHNSDKNLKINVINNSTKLINIKLNNIGKKKLKYRQHIESKCKINIANIYEPIQLYIVELDKTFIIDADDVNDVERLYVIISDQEIIIRPNYYRQTNKYKINSFNIKSILPQVESEYKIKIYSQNKLLAEIHSTDYLVQLNNLLSFGKDIKVEIHYQQQVLTTDINSEKVNLIHWNNQQIIIP